MNKAKSKYMKKCKKREIAFYLKDKDIYEYSKQINFQKTVKEHLRIMYNIDKIEKRIEGNGR